MNFKELREEVNSALDYNPDLAAYRDQVGRVVNRHYLQISNQFPWLFLQKRINMTLKATYEGSASITAEILVGNLRKVTISSAVVSTDWEGHTFVGADSTEYTINYVESTQIFYLTTEYSGSPSMTAGSASWSVKFKRFALPDNCQEVLGIMSRADDRGRLLFLDARKEEEHFLDVDDTGDIVCFIEDEHFVDRPPRKALTASLASGTAGATLETGVDYQYCYTIYREGRESPPSVVTEASAATGAATPSTIAGAISDLEDLSWDPATPRSSGTKARVYRRDKTNNGRWLLVKQLDVGDATPTTSFTDDRLAGYDISGNQNDGFDDAAYLSEAGPSQTIRVWRTPTSDTTIEIRFLARPRRMDNDSDSPEWPIQYQHVLVYRALEDICMQHGMPQQSQIYERRATVLLDNMKSKYLSRPDRTYVRGGFDKALAGQVRWGIPSKV